MNNKLKGLIGLCRKSGNLLCGATAVEFAVKSKNCRLVLIAEDAGVSIRKKIETLCISNEIDYKIVFNKEWLGNAAGLDGKAVVAVKSKDFAEGILNLI